MYRDSVDWYGPMPAVITPFDAAGAIDEPALRANIERQLAAGATGVLVGGCTGEFWSLTTSERMQLFKASAGIMNGRGTLLAGTGAVTVAETVQLSNAAMEAG